MKYKVQHFIDFATRGDTMQIVNFSVGGKDLMARCSHLIGAYRYFKLGRISIKLIPASTLPVDPTGLSYDDEDLQTVDPRDQLNPGLIRITNGEDIADSGIENLSDIEQQRLYQAMMLDPRWYKFQLQSGFRRSARPLFWYVGQLHQDSYPGAIVNLPGVTVGETSQRISSTFAQYRDGTDVDADAEAADRSFRRHDFSDPHGFFQTGKKGRMGWLRTDCLQEFGGAASASGGASAGVYESPMLVPFPTCRVITMVLPKMFKTNYFYRCYVTEEIYFSGVRNFSPAVDGYIGAGIDSFVQPPTIYTGRFPTSDPDLILDAGKVDKYNDGNWGV